MIYEEFSSSMGCHDSWIREIDPKEVEVAGYWLADEMDGKPSNLGHLDTNGLAN